MHQQFYLELCVLPFVTLPWRPASEPAAALQVFGLCSSALVANRGCSQVVLIILALSLVGDGFHKAIWSDELLANWGCRGLGLTSMVSEEEAVEKEASDAETGSSDGDEEERDE